MKQIINLVAIHFLFFLSIVQADQEPIKIGVIAPLTGNQAQIGHAIENGLKMAQADHPRLFKSTKIILEDSQFNNRTAVAAFKKLSEIDQVKLIYVFGHGQSHTLAPLAEAAKVPLVACTGEKNIEDNRSYVIRFFVPHEWFGYILLNHLRSKGYKRLGLIKSELSFIENIFRGLKAHLSKHESLEIVEIHSGNDTDFKTSIAKAKTKNFDSLGVFLGQGQIAPFYHQLNQLQFKVPTFGTHAFESTEEIKQAGDTIEGAVLPAITASAEFKARYRKMFGHETFVAFSANAYDFAVLGTRLSAKHTESALAMAFKQITNELGASGRFGYKQKKDFGTGFIFPVAMKEIRQGELLEVAHMAQ